MVGSPCPLATSRGEPRSWVILHVGIRGCTSSLCFLPRCHSTGLCRGRSTNRRRKCPLHQKMRWLELDRRRGCLPEYVEWQNLELNQRCGVSSQSSSKMFPISQRNRSGSDDQNEHPREIQRKVWTLRRSRTLAWVGQ